MPPFAQRQNRSQSSYLVSPAKHDRSTPWLVHAEHSLLAQQQALGNQAVQRLLSSGMIQAKLTISEPGDQYEQEADRVADQVMRMSGPGVTERAPVAGQTHSTDMQRMCSKCQDELHRQPMKVNETVSGQAHGLRIQRSCPKCEEELHRESVEEEGKEPLQSKEVSGHTPEVTPGVRAQVNALRGGGQPLSESVRTFFEPRFGYDFSQVRIHTDAGADESARAVNARAFTVGRDVVFGAGQYAPGTATGQRLLAHELAHTIQQTGGGIASGRRHLPHLQRTIGDGHDLQSPRFAGDPVLEACFDNERLLKVGASGPAVEKIQLALIDLGFPLPRFGVDGIFGSETRAAVQDYQRAKGLVADGIVGPITMGSLDAQFPAPPTPTRQPPTLPPPTQQPPTLPPPTRPLSDALDLARITSVSLTVIPNDVVRQKTNGVVEVATEITATASAQLSPGPGNTLFTFGFIQICRPFDIAHATYLESGATLIGNNTLDFNASTNMRTEPPGLPALDHPTPFFPDIKGSEIKGSPGANGRLAPLTFIDTPRTQFQVDTSKNDKFYTISGLAVEAFFFTAFAVRLPSGTTVPLKTFHWDFKRCEALPNPPLPALANPVTGGKANVSPVRDCRTGHCDRGEPGFERAGESTAVTDTCLSIVTRGFQKTLFNGPGNFDIGCK